MEINPTTYGDEEEEEPIRPAAAEALRKLQAEEEPKRGHLRIYVAMAPGSGKTYAMLHEGRRRKGRGTDVVVGYVETYNRPLTVEAIGDLEIIPRKQIPYKGVTLEEMDTEAIIRRKPQVALVDELAHTNAPGSKNPKRWQDVEEIRDAGITVVSTLNIQHLESLNNTVESITGVKVRETLPDRVMDEADEVELIDISPDALVQRMKHGNIYPPERAQQALNNYFRKGNLAALREMALRRVADKVESQLESYMREHDIEGPWTPAERVLVAFDHRPLGRRLLRRAWRIADALDTDLLAVFVGDPDKLDKAGREGLAENRQLAEDLGARVTYLSPKPDIAGALIEFARDNNVGQVVLGQSARSRWESLLRGSVTNKILHSLKDVDVHLIADRGEEEKT
jgi:two-component system sensor histidine kinase KdpD